MIESLIESVGAKIIENVITQKGMPARQKYPWAEIEADIFSDNRPLDYKEIARKWNIPLDRVRTRSNRERWKERKQGVQLLVREERKKNVRENCLGQVFGIDMVSLDVAEALLTEVSSRLEDTRRRRERGEESGLRCSDLVALGRVATMASELARYHHGDLGTALNTLVEAGIIPEKIVPQILFALDESETNLSESLKRAFFGRIPD